MKKFISVKDIVDLPALLTQALSIAKNPLQNPQLGQHKTLLMVFFNSSLRTRLSTQKAALNLGMNLMVLDVSQGMWKLETNAGVIMDGDKPEHIKEAIPVMTSFCDIVAVRAFSQLQSKEADYSEQILTQFLQLSSKPVLSMESAIRHPLQSLADIITIEQLKLREKPKVVLSWAPHPRALPQAVPNSFAEWVNVLDYELVITHPPGYELDQEFVGNATVEYQQTKALAGADFVYAKNWSVGNAQNYGTILSNDSSWTISEQHMALTNNGKFMHCLPVRRNVEVMDSVIDGANSVVIQQANNRVNAAQAILQQMLLTNSSI